MSRRRRLLNGTAAGSPRVIDGLTAWLAADAIPLGTVVSYTDPLGITYTQGTASERPTNTASQINGKPALVFDGGDNLFSDSADLLSVFNGSHTIFGVAKRNVDSGTQIIMASQFSRSVLFYGASAGDILYRSNQAATGLLTNAGNATTSYNIIRARRSGTTQALAVNGGTEATNANGSNVSGITHLILGSNTLGASLLTGGIAEILIYNRSLSTSEIQAVEFYLANKYGI
jgi:hypothetical protein